MHSRNHPRLFAEGVHPSYFFTHGFPGPICQDKEVTIHIFEASNSLVDTYIAIARDTKAEIVQDFMERLRLVDEAAMGPKACHHLSVLADPCPSRLVTPVCFGLRGRGASRPRRR